MIELANKYKTELTNKCIDTWFVDKYKFYFACPYPGEITIETGTWNEMNFVSKNSKGDIIGYIGYNVNRYTNVVSSFHAINFTDERICFGLDLKTVIDDIFLKFNFGKLNISVVVGNPIEKSYDKMILKFGGRVIGVYKDDCKLFDNKFYDLKHYELMRNEYLENK